MIIDIKYVIKKLVSVRLAYEFQDSAHVEWSCCPKLNQKLGTNNGVFQYLYQSLVNNKIIFVNLSWINVKSEKQH